MRKKNCLGILFLLLMLVFPCEIILADDISANTPDFEERSTALDAEPADEPEPSGIPNVTDAPEPSGAPDVTDVPEPSEPPGETDTPDLPVEPSVTPTPKPIPRGLVKENGKYRFYKKSGERVRKKWKRVESNGRKYYFNKYGNAVIGSKKIKGQYYVFNNKGQLLEPKKLKIVSITSGKYCVDSKGRPRVGWQIINGNLYSVKETGRIRVNTTYQEISFDKNGKAKMTTTANLKIKTMSVLSGITNSQMSSGQKLSACWGYLTGGSFWYAYKYPNLNVAGWQRSMALDMLQTHCGNCYGFACAFAALAKEIGYSPVVICGRVPGSRDGAGDGMTRHSWVLIGGRHFDPEAQYAGWLTGVYNYGGYPMYHTIQAYVNF